jgi:hypothetical protein
MREMSSFCLLFYKILVFSNKKKCQQLGKKKTKKCYVPKLIENYSKRNGLTNDGRLL